MSRIPSTGTIANQQAPSSTDNDLRDVKLDQFLQLMIAELQNQDPLNPMDNSEFVAQISQIRQIGATNLLTETLGSVLTGQQLGTASNLIGKRISALNEDDENVEGVVDRVTVEVNEEKNDERTFKLHLEATDENGEITQHVIDLKDVRDVFGDAA